MNVESERRSARVFAQLLLEGQRVDWRHSLVVVLVITGMFSTPLALGSIRNRVYVAVRDQIEKENNVREIAVQLSQDNAPPLDDGLIAQLEENFPGLQAVGNHKVVVSVDGPQGADFLTLQTLTPDDPRQAHLRVFPPVPEEFGLTDVVVSDALGRLLYGEEWEDSWQSGTFTGPALKVAINDLPLSPLFRVVSRRRLPGRGLYVSPATGSALRRYTEGFGAAELGLPADQALIEHSLPKLATSSCLLLLDAADPTCDGNGRDRLERRLAQLQLAVRPANEPTWPHLPSHEALLVELFEIVDEDGATERREVLADCFETLSPHLVETCKVARVLPDLGLTATLERADGNVASAAIVAADAEVRHLLPQAQQLADQHGIAPPAKDGAMRLTAPAVSFDVGEELSVKAGGVWVPGRVERLYDCQAEDATCALFSDPLAVFRLQNLADGLVELSSRQPPVFVPTRTAPEFDEILAYAPQVEDVERASRELRDRYPGYSVQYNVAALDKLKRQDSRLSTLFTLTISLSALFIVLALGALARINIERRGRQMAQMLILGFPRRFVRRLVVAEYLLLTSASATAALGLTWLLCSLARRLLSTGPGGSDQGFEVIVQSMGVDLRAFLQVLVIFGLCTWVIAALSARQAARTDPLNLLD